jgi:hypothetical protein
MLVMPIQLEHNILEKSNIVGAYNAQETTIVEMQISFISKSDDLTAPKISVLPNGGMLRKFSNDLTSLILEIVSTIKYF